MIRILLSLIAIVFVTSNVTDEKKRHPHKHDFPEYSPRGVLTANEFQMILPENIIDGRKKTLIDTQSFSIDNVSPLVINNNDIVTVKYSTKTPSNSDWIGAYSPANSVDITTTVPIKYGYCDEDSNYEAYGYGELTFNMTNVRNDIVFYYFTGGTSHPIVVDKYSKNVQFYNNNEPLKPRIVPTGDYNKFKLLWSSASSSQPLLKWGTKSNSYDKVVEASTSSIDRGELCGSPANSTGWFDLGLIHEAMLEGMEPLANQKIYYKFGDEATNDYSKEYVFNVPPLPGKPSERRPTTAILYDDLGRGSTDMTYTWYEYGRPAIDTIMAVGAEIANGDIDVIYHGGDISYAVGYLAVWDFYMDMLSNVAGSVLYLTTVGNHESDWKDSASSFSNTDSGGECGILTTTLYPMPSPATTNEPWWSYNVGLFHFVGISTEHDYTIGSKQYYWLEKDLASVDRSVTPWIIFGGHRAMYINSNYGGSPSSDIGVMDSMIENLEPLLFKYRVNIGFYGHNHAVQRHSAVLNKKVIQASEKIIDEEGNIVHFHNDPQATVHMVVGTGGATFTQNAVNPPPEWNEMVFYEYGYARITAVNATYLDWKWIKASTNEVLDRMVITQEDPTTETTWDVSKGK